MGRVSTQWPGLRAGGTPKALAQKLAALGLAFLALTLFVTPALAQNRYTNSTDGAVSETVTPCTAPLIRSFPVSEIYTVSDVNIGVLMSHTYRGDLLMYLQAPSGLRVQLFTGTGTSSTNFNVLLDDGAASAVIAHAANDIATATTAAPPYQRALRPANALSAFNGLNANGVWTLEICDRYAADSGIFYQSDLFLTAAPATLSVTKTSAVVSDGVNMSGPKAIPGAVIRYCISITNQGPGIASGITATDNIPSILGYVGGTMLSGGTCAATTIAEDDNSSGPDESDPFGASIAGTTITISTASMAAGSSFALAFNATVN
jgi:uncharacterized repeat protein (TIGR01451 family)